ncbi:hypothetical protein G7054_g9789 [Neopestalotiopsis clavispora]|nr:hypothetical protein G7054_g9789 [Neopestalotiopsis clavispora]
MYSLLDLPKEVRHSIYETAGLVSGITIRLAPKGTHDWDIRPPAESLRFTYNILQTCKAVHDEVKSLICAHNTLVVVYEHVEYGLDLLRRLSPQQCSVLTSVFVQLHFEVIDHEHGESRYSEYDEYRPDQPLPPPSSALISSWQMSARHILTNATPQSLNLGIVCETGLSDTTIAVLKPLNDHPGILRGCELQFGHQRQDGAIRAIAWEKAARASGLNPDLRSRPFPLFKLPVEIRRQILEYTDLVTPHKEVYWSVSRGFRIIAGRNRCDGEDCPPQLHRTCRFLSCNLMYLPWKPTVCLKTRSGYSTRCQCWVPPRSIFTVSHALYREAVQVLYSCNRVIVVPSKGLRACLDHEDRTKRLDVSRFITRHMWSDALRSLREFEIVFPPINHRCVEPSDDPYYLDWCFAVSHLASHTRHGQLKVIVNMTTARSILQGLHLLTDRQLPLSEGYRSVVLRSHGHLLVPLMALRCIGQFFVHVEWAWHWCPEHPSVGCDRGPEIAAEVDSIESHLEKMVMGNEYDSLAVGRSKECPSVWLYGVWNFIEYVWWDRISASNMYRI